MRAASVEPVYVSKRMRDCPGVGRRKYDVECVVVRWGPNW